MILAAFILAACGIPESYDYQTIMHEVHEAVAVAYDPADVWQTPAATEMLGTGDCEDFAILMLQKVFDRYGVMGNMVIVYGETAHAIVELDIYYDPMYNKTFQYPEGRIGPRLSYWQAVRIAERY